MSGEQMDEVQQWLGDAMARNLKPLLYAMYSGMLLLIIGTASVVGTWYDLRESTRAAKEEAAAAKTAIETQVKPTMANHETRLVVLEFIGKGATK